ncbi:MAG: hypothetical protein ABI977_05650 [Acidobacteriota bacterium]
MATAEKQAQKARADNLRDLIQQIVSGETHPAKSVPESPRDYVNRKMHEVEKEENKPSGSKDSCATNDQSN